MSIPHPSTCPIVAALPAGELFDALDVHPPPSALDAEGSADESASPGAAVTLMGSVQTPKTGEVTRMEGGTDGEAPYGETSHEILFAPPSGRGSVPYVALASIVAGTRIDWTANALGAIAPAITLTAEGPARPCGGLGGRWTVSCVARR